MSTVIDINSTNSLIVECGTVSTNSDGIAIISANSTHGSNATLLLSPKNNSVTAFIINKIGLNFTVETSFPNCEINYKITSTS